MSGRRGESRSPSGWLLLSVEPGDPWSRIRDHFGRSSMQTACGHIQPEKGLASQSGGKGADVRKQESVLSELIEPLASVQKGLRRLLLCS